MGWDIHAYAEKRVSGRWTLIDGLHPFDERNYGVFGFLADVMNLSAVPPISQARGLPTDASEQVIAVCAEWAAEAAEMAAPSWLLLTELTSFDYEVEMEDRRVRSGRSAGTCSPGNGRRVTFRQFLGANFFRDLDALQRAGAERVVFWFDH